MHCLYCDRPLALLKRLTGDGEFCSKEHRKIYQKEHNQLALARLLESQPGPRGKSLRSTNAPNAQNAKPEPVAAKPVAAPVKEGAGRQPERADFILEFLPETIAVSDVDRSTGVRRVWTERPVLEESPAANSGPKPKTADFLAGSPAPFPGGGAGFRSKSLLEPLAGRRQLAEAPRSGRASLAIRCQPAGAGFLAEGPPSPVLSKAASGTASAAAAAKLSGPRFRALAAKMGGGHSAGDPQHKLLPAAFLAMPVARAQSRERVRGSAVEPRWKPLATALPAQPVGKITFVLGTLLQRPIRVAGQDSLPEIFEIRIRPISFPQYLPRMGILEDRAHPTDQIGFTPL